MPWFRIDDGLPQHPKLEVLETDPALHAAAIALWTLAGADSMARLTDGRVTKLRVARLLPFWPEDMRDRACKALVRCGLWVRDDDAYLFHDWHDCQPSVESVKREREASRARQAAWKARRRGGKGGNEPEGGDPDEEPEPVSNGSGNAVTDGVSNATSSPVATPVATPAPSRPVPSRSSFGTGESPREVSDAIRDRIATAWRTGYCRRYEPLGIAPSPPAGAELATLIDRACAQKDPDAYVTAALDGFFGDAWAIEARFPIANLAKNADRYAAKKATPKARPKPRAEDPDKYRPAGEWNPADTGNVVTLGQAGAALLESLNIRRPA